MASYSGFIQLVDLAFMRPGDDWSVEIAKVAADPTAFQLREALKGTAALGQYGSGFVSVSPLVTGVQPGLVDMTVCVDSSAAGFFDKDGVSIKAPDQAGSYFRHVSQVQVAKYASGAWLVTLITDDYNSSC